MSQVTRIRLPDGSLHNVSGVTFAPMDFAEIPVPPRHAQHQPATAVREPGPLVHRLATATGFSSVARLACGAAFAGTYIPERVVSRTFRGVTCPSCKIPGRHQRRYLRDGEAIGKKS